MDTKNYLNTKVKVIMDRKMGSSHPKYGFIYPVNYGYVPNTISGDGDIMTFNKGKERYKKATKVYDLTGNQEVQNYTFKSPTELSKTATEREPDEDENEKIYSEAIDDFLFRHRFDI